MVKATTGPSLVDRSCIGCALGLLVGAPAAFGFVVLTANVWATCDVGINASANSFTLMFALPALWMTNSVVFGLAFATVPGPTWKRRALGSLVGLLALILLAWILFAWQITPSDYPSPICHENVPPWWPSWIPA